MRCDTYATRLLSGAHLRADSLAAVRVRRWAVPPCCELAANTSPRTTKASFLPSGETDRSLSGPVSRSDSTAGDDTAPIRRIGTSLVSPEAVFKVQIARLRSNATVRPSREIVGHSTRPFVNFVICRGSATRPVTAAVQMFSTPLRSDMNNRLRPSAAHIGHSALPLRATTC